MTPTYSRVIELHKDTWDPTYGSGEPGIFDAVTCHVCGALIDAAATDNHTSWHQRIEVSP